jgi:hypothetical protein
MVRSVVDAEDDESSYLSYFGSRIALVSPNESLTSKTVSSADGDEAWRS